MALSGGAAKGIALLVGAVFTAAGIYAFQVSKRRGVEGEAEREAVRELVAIAGRMAKCGLGTHGLPGTSHRVPSKLADVSAKAYTSKAEDWKDPAFECAEYQLNGPQYLQYRWYKSSESRGRIEARGDLDGNGRPDTWYEVQVTCSDSRNCAAANYVSTVDEDGVRQPPAILRWLGRSDSFLGEPPSLSADDEVAPAPVAVPSAKPLETVIAGAPTPINTLFFEAERRAAAKVPGVVLLELQLTGVRERVGDPKQGLKLRGLYGSPEGKGRVPSGAEVVSVTYDQDGFAEALVKASQEFHAVGFAECLPEKLLLVVEPPGALTMTLAWNKAHERAVWTTQAGKRPPTSYGADKCALVK